MDFFFLLRIATLSEQGKVIHETIDPKPAANSVTSIREGSVEGGRLFHSASSVNMGKESGSPHPHVSLIVSIFTLLLLRSIFRNLF